MYSTYDYRDNSGRDFDRLLWEEEQARIEERRQQEAARLVSPEYVRQQEELRARVQRINERKATMPRLSQSTFDVLTDWEKAQARRARGRMLRMGHKAAGYFRHVLGPNDLLGNWCEDCGRWITVDGKTGEFAGTAHTEGCDR